MKLHPSVVLVLTLIACDSPGGSRGGNGTFTRADTSATGDSVQGDATATTDPQADVVSPADTSPTTALPDVTTSCTPLGVSGTLSGASSAGQGAWSIEDLAVGGPSPDALSLSFESNATGSFDFAGETPNDCTRCVSLYVDLGSGGQQYFASEGDITVAAAPYSNLDVTLRDVRLTAVSGGSLDFGGPCFTVAQVRLTGEGQTCTPSCGAKECGSDGCGGTCGSCTGNETCNSSGQCVGGSSSSCTALSLSGPLEADVEYPNVYYAEALDGVFTAEFFAEGTGSFSLTSGGNGNYATCDQCMLLRLGGDGSDIYFQTAGSVSVSGFPFDGDVSIALSNLELRQVTVSDDDTFTSTLVPGGRCYRVTSASLSTP